MHHLTSAFAPPGWRHRALARRLLLASSVGFTLGFAHCAVPFAAFGAVAAMTLPRRDALLLTVALWLVNQIVGFAVLHYPWDAMTLTWGAIFAGVAVLIENRHPHRFERIVGDRRHAELASFGPTTPPSSKN